MSEPMPNWNGRPLKVLSRIALLLDNAGLEPITFIYARSCFSAVTLSDASISRRKMALIRD
jgi:hypothetical protein